MTRYEYVKTVLEPQFKNQNELYHYGTPRHSGRYPYGSGKRPYQSEKIIDTDDLSMVNDIYKEFNRNDRISINGGDIEDVNYDYLFSPEGEFYNNPKEYGLDTMKVIKKGTKPVAFFGADRLWDFNNNTFTNETEAYLGVSPSYRGQGYASKVTEAGMNDLLKNDSINKIWWRPIESNTASIKLAEKYGFDYIGDLPAKDGKNIIKNYVYDKTNR